MWKKLFILTVVRHRNRWPREAVEVFKARMDRALSNLVYWKVSLLMAGELEFDDP